MSLHQEAVRALARALQFTLVESSTRNPFRRGHGRYCLWQAGTSDGPIHNATLVTVQRYLTEQAEAAYRAHQSRNSDEW